MPGTIIPIQHLVFPLQPGLAPLYLRTENAEGSGRVLAAAQLPRWSRYEVMIPPGSAVVLDTHFNHLPEAYWRRHTRALSFAFSASLHGHGRVELWRRRADGRNTLLAVGEIDRDEADTLTLNVNAGKEDDGVLFVRVAAGSRPMTLQDGVWQASAMRVMPVRLVAGYCTYLRETELLDNVRTIMGDTVAAALLEVLVVVDQGRSQTMGPALRELDRDGRIAFIQQDNLGGSGGFTRVILEALNRQEATHVLLLDDDARMEPESIFRAAVFLSLSEGKAVGGQMFDLSSPLRIYEQGGSLDPETLRFSRGHGSLVPVGPHGITPFATLQPSQWNGWWFFAVPLSAVRAAGLPLPLFLRYDDVEYGLRLSHQGIETVGVPGIAVWHEPFYLNKGGWQGFFDARNFLAATTIRVGLSRSPALRHVVRSVLGCLLSYDYYGAWLYCEGVADWLTGPSCLDTMPGRRLDYLRRMAADFREDDLEAGEVDLGHRPGFPPPPVGPELRRALIRQIIRTLAEPSPAISSAPPPGLSAGLANWWVLSGYRDVAIEPLSPGGAWKRLRRSPRRFRSIFARLVVLSLRFALFAPLAARRWRQQADDLASISRWRHRLALCPEE